MKKRILACLLALVMLIGAMPVMALAAEPEAEKPASFDWEVSKSKTATALDADGSTRVTLSLPSAEENLATDVLLVLDASKCAKDMLLATIDLIDDLNTQVEAGANIKVGIVMFKGNAVPFLSLTEGTDLKALKSTLESLIVEDDNADGDRTKAKVRSYVAKTFPEFMNSGTNIPAGLQLAKNMLAEDTAVTDARKYVVLVSDGDTYLFCHEGSNGYDYTKAYTRSGPRNTVFGGISESAINWDWNTPAKIKFDKANETHKTHEWDLYLEYVGKNTGKFSRYDFEADAEAFNKEKYPTWFKQSLLIPADEEDRIVNSDTSRYQTAQLYRELQSKYNTYYCYLPGGYDMARTMLKDLTPVDHLIDTHNGGSTAFSAITEDIVFAVGRGSIVEDYMGYDTSNGNNYNFDFVPGSLILTVGGQSLAFLQDDNTYYFGDTGVNKKNWHFKVEYKPANDENEKLVWTINEAVSNFSRVQLSYQLRLRDDARTSKDNYFYTNFSATLKPIDVYKRQGKGSPFRGRFPLSGGNVPKGQKG